MKGNIKIPHSIAKTIDHGKITKVLPLVEYNDTHVPLFTVISPTKCEKCGGPLKKNKEYFRYILYFSDVLEIKVNYQRCKNPKCKKFHTDQIIGVDKGRNYSNDYLDAMEHVRHEGKCSLNNTNKVGIIFAEKTGNSVRAPCATILWKQDQVEGKKALGTLRETDVNFNGKIYCDGIWIKTLRRKDLEKLLGREITPHQWKLLRYKVVYVVATKEKVVLDFEITDINPPSFALNPLFNRIKRRFGAGSVKHLVSDEDSAIMEAVVTVFPDVKLSFCVFHQLKHIRDKFLKVYKYSANISDADKSFLDLFVKIILSESVIEASAYFQDVKKLMEKGYVSAVVKKVFEYVKNKYFSNRKLFEKNITPETNNTMEQIFSTIKDFIFQCRSFKLVSGLRNFMAILFNIKNSGPFVSGKHRGKSPLELNRSSVCAPS